MADLRPIPTPLSQQWRRIRYQLVPVLVFGAAIGMTFWLWGRQSGLAHAVGEVEVTRFDVTAPADGLLVPLAGTKWEQFKAVRKGDILVRMDDRAAVAALGIIQSQISALQKQLQATEARDRQDLADAALDQADRQYRWLMDARRFARDVEGLRLDILDRKRRIAADQAEYQRLTARLQTLQRLAKRDAVAEFELQDYRLNVAQLEKKIKGRQEALARADEELKIARTRRDSLQKQVSDFPRPDLASIDTLLAPIRAEIAVQEARMAELRIEIAQAEIQAPFDGMIREILHYPNQTVRMGEPIMTLVADQTPHVITYIRQHHRVGPEIGMAVDIRVRTMPVRRIKGQIAEIGPQVVRVPRQHLRDPQTAEWGLPVRIAAPQTSGLQPGEMVDLTFHRENKGGG